MAVILRRCRRRDAVVVLVVAVVVAEWAHKFHVTR